MKASESYVKCGIFNNINRIVSAMPVVRSMVRSMVIMYISR